MKKPLIIVHHASPRKSSERNDALAPLQAFVDEAWEEEKQKFQEETGFIIQPADSLEKVIKVCEEKGLKHHMFYHLMVIKSNLFNQSKAKQS